jgi:Bacterial sugar transferase
MVQNAEKATGPVWSSQSDCRVTKIGRWLRASHLDELPQIFNVLAGHMHLVGPRPERPEFVSGLSRDIRGYDRRHLVRPGITGLAQVKQGYDSCIGDVAKKVELDLVYVQTASLALDLKILFLTAPFIIGEVWSVALRKLRAQEREPAIVVPPIQSTKSELGPEFQIQLDIEDLLNTAPSTKSVVPKPKLTGISTRERRASPRRDGVKETEKTTEG